MKMHLTIVVCVRVVWLKLKSLLLSSCLTLNEPRTDLKSFYKGQFWLQTHNPGRKSCWALFRVSQKVILYSDWSEVKLFTTWTSISLSFSSSVLHCSLKLPGLWPTLHQGRLHRHRLWSNPVSCLDRPSSTGSISFDYVSSLCIRRLCPPLILFPCLCRCCPIVFETSPLSSSECVWAGRVGAGKHHWWVTEMSLHCELCNWKEQKQKFISTKERVSCFFILLATNTNQPMRCELLDVMSRTAATYILVVLTHWKLLVQPKLNAEDTILDSIIVDMPLTNL